MTNPIDEQEAREAAMVKERQQAKMLEERSINDMRKVMEMPEARRLLWEFMTVAGVDVSPLRTEVVYMSAAVAWQDAAAWWINAMRKACPEREAQMRAEARKRLPVESKENA